MNIIEYLNYFYNYKPTFTICRIEDNRWRVSAEVNNRKLVAYDKDIVQALAYAANLYVKEVRRLNNESEGK